MVLKVVRGKILETLELAWYPTAFSFTRVGRAFALKDVSEKTSEAARKIMSWIKDRIILQIIFVFVCYRKWRVKASEKR